MKTITAVDLVWIATASLTREFEGRTGFSPEEIQKRVHELEPHTGFSESTIRTHIGSYCVAQKKPNPGKHRKLYANADGTYRLYWSGDLFHPGRRNGKTLPDPNRIPRKYHDLLGWYCSHDRASPKESKGNDPILALRGLGRDVWRDLGGGEKFIRELRARWFGVETPERRVTKAKPVKRNRDV